MKRVRTPELLDADLGTSAEIAASLEDLRWINRWFGGVHTSRRLLEHAMQRAGIRAASVLSVATGDGFSIASTVAAVRDSGAQVNLILSDSSPSHLGTADGCVKVAAAAQTLPFADASIDFVECSLFAHHLSEAELVAFTREALRVARHALLINDLRRGATHLLFVHLGRALYRSPMTSHDAVASVRAAYTPAEIRELLWRAGAVRVEVSRSWFFRMGAIAWKR